MSQVSEFSHVLVGVTHVASVLLSQIVESVGTANEDHIGFEAGRLNILSDTSDVQAAELPLTPGSEDMLNGLHWFCKDHEHVDFALLPNANRKKRLLISDMDSTIIGQECLDELADFAGLKAEVSAITERAMRGELNFEEALTTRVSMLKGLKLDALQACYEDRITLMPGAQAMVATMKAHGAETLLVSGGFTFFTERVAQQAGFDAHRGNTLIDDGAALTGQVGMPILGREAKLTALEAALSDHKLSIDDALAIGDGANDLAMIKAAGLGIAFEAKPVVAEEATAAINHTDLRTALFFQGYTADEIVEGPGL
jgi:phosphoserine phosphatase